MTGPVFLTVAAALHGLPGLPGVAALAVPAATAGAFGLAAEAGTEPVIRLLGAPLIGAAAAFGLARNAGDGRAMQAILIAGLAINVFSPVVVGAAIADGLMQPRAVAGAAMRALLAAGFGWFAIRGKPPLCAAA